ncbi:MAG: DUF3160 domain-containing protein [Planctomycetes bacterium]|nr:DUF3160 domain-containing protein [Planctomycetota bacterium]
MKKLLALGLLLFSEVPAQEKTSGREGFQILPQKREKDLIGLYGQYASGGRNIAITTDLVLHVMHLLFDYTLRAVEIDKLAVSLESLARDLLDESDRRAGASEGGLREAHRGNVAFLGVALRCLRPDAKLPAYAEDPVKKDLELIREHKRFELSAALPNKEDFSQYVPRGHYTRNEAFERYFRAMMWFGRRMFRVAEKDPDASGEPRDPWSPAHARAETRQFLLLVGLLHRVPQALDRWRRIDDVIQVFVGEPDDLSPLDAEALAKEIYGGIPEEKELLDEGRLDRFIAESEKRAQPRIDSSGMGREGFNVIGQRTVPDSVVTQRLVFSTHAEGQNLSYTGKGDLPFTGKMTRIGPKRCFPRGLDVMAAFGSDLAREILKSLRDDQFEGYDRLLEEMKREFGKKLEDAGERKSVYWDWLYAVKPLLADPPAGAPAFMKEKAWKRKMLAAALASWAELRHDTILYVKQSYTGEGKGLPPQPEFGYVEPYPDVYARAAATLARLRKLLEARGAAVPDFQAKYEEFEKVLGFLESVARKELRGERLSKEEHKAVLAVPWRLRSVASLSEEWTKRIASDADLSMALVADVHTDNNRPPEVLEEAVGYPAMLKLSVTVDGQVREFWGAVFTYYEFRWPKEDRLTDEKWQKMLEDGKAPAATEWLKP